MLQVEAKVVVGKDLLSCFNGSVPKLTIRVHHKLIDLCTWFDELLTSSPHM